MDLMHSSHTGTQVDGRATIFLQLSITVHKERVRSGGSHCENQEVQPRSHPVHFSYNSFCRTSHMVLSLTIKGIDV